MKIIKLISLIAVIVMTMSSAQASDPDININGTYIMHIRKGQPIWVLHIDDDKYEILRETNEFPIFLSDTISKGSVQYDESNFIKLSSEPLYTKISEGIKYRGYRDDAIKDSIRIVLQIYNPDLISSTKIQVHISTHTFDLEDDNTVLTIPKKTADVDYFQEIHNGNLSFAITPVDLLYGFMETAWSYVAFNSYEITFDFKNKDSNLFEIEIPDLKPDYFTRYVIYDEYCKVTPTSLTWRGMVFEKVSDQIIDLKTAQEQFYTK